ncbi:hypothetical protein BJ992_006286 [Sphaerisporangium rubeum]|uniref:Uncharacterized protein n=1 Tax=Sphaerisporangium rubeum TaxID=321317 RepID=A0A7X0M9P4_9ACTN|nr:hypothetical protein [Sphaerisporangium rubeum]
MNGSTGKRGAAHDLSAPGSESHDKLRLPSVIGADRH